MNIIASLSIDNQTYTAAEIGRCDRRLLQQYWEARTAIWTYRYPEIAGEDGLERDHHDASASFIVLIEGADQVIAGTRLIHADSVAKLPIGSCARVQIPGPAVEVSRFFFSPTAKTEAEYTEQQFKLFIYGIVNFLQGQGYERAYATIRSSLLTKLQTLGVPIVPNGPVQAHGNKEFTPAMMFETGESFVSAQTQPNHYRLAA